MSAVQMKHYSNLSWQDFWTAFICALLWALLLSLHASTIIKHESWFWNEHKQRWGFVTKDRRKLIWFQREMLLPCGNVCKWAAENIKCRRFKHSVRSLIWHICPSAFFKLFPLQMCHKASGGFGSAVWPDGKRQRWLCGPVPVRRGRTRYPQNSVPATKTVPLHRRQLWGTSTAMMWMVFWDGPHIKVVLQS